MGLLFFIVFFILPTAHAEMFATYHLDAQQSQGGIKDATEAQGNFFLGYSYRFENHRFHSSLIATHGHSPARIVGDLQTTSNLDSGGLETVRLFETYWEYKSSQTKVLIGLFDLASEFNITDPAGVFIHSSPGTSAELAAAGPAGTGFNPFSALSVRVHQDLTENLYLKTAVTDATPIDTNSPYGTQLDLRSEQGYFRLLEMGFKSENIFNFGAGVWDFTEFGDSGHYFQMDFEMPNGLKPFLRHGHTYTKSRIFSSNSVAGMVKDSWGAMVSIAEFSDNKKDNEIASELNYLYEYERAQIIPNFQYIQNPGQLDNAAEAFLVGLRINLMLL